MKNSDKKTAIIVGICIILVILFSYVLIIKNRKDGSRTDKVIDSDRVLYIHQVIDIENLDTSLYADIMKKTSDFNIASKYQVDKKATIINANIDIYLDGNMAKAIYIRENNINLNVVQLRYDVTGDEITPTEIKVEEIMREFDIECKSNMGVMDLEREPTELSIKNENIPYSESIYQKKELYSARYKVEEEYSEMNIDQDKHTKTYDINYYMDGDNTLVCEFVRVL